MSYQTHGGLAEIREFNLIRTYFKEVISLRPKTVPIARVDRVFTDKYLREIRDSHAPRVFYSWLIRAYAHHHRKRTDV